MKMNNRSLFLKCQPGATAVLMWSKRNEWTLYSISVDLAVHSVNDSIFKKIYMQVLFPLTKLETSW